MGDRYKNREDGKKFNIDLKLQIRSLKKRPLEVFITERSFVLLVFGKWIKKAIGKVIIFYNDLEKIY